MPVVVDTLGGPVGTPLGLFVAFIIGLCLWIYIKKSASKQKL